MFASAIDQMLQMDKLPTLFMRTVLQALITHPRMTSQIINTLIKLISRWENKILKMSLRVLCLVIYAIGVLEKYGLRAKFGMAL